MQTSLKLHMSFSKLQVWDPAGICLFMRIALPHAALIWGSSSLMHACAFITANIAFIWDFSHASPFYPPPHPPPWGPGLRPKVEWVIEFFICKCECHAEGLPDYLRATSQNARKVNVLGECQIYTCVSSASCPAVAISNFVVSSLVELFNSIESSSYTSPLIDFRNDMRDIAPIEAFISFTLVDISDISLSNPAMYFKIESSFWSVCVRASHLSKSCWAWSNDIPSNLNSTVLWKSVNRCSSASRRLEEEAKWPWTIEKWCPITLNPLTTSWRTRVPMTAWWSLIIFLIAEWWPSCWSLWCLITLPISWETTRTWELWFALSL